MTWEEIKQSDKLWLTPDEVATAIGKNSQDLRWQAHTRPDLLGYPVSVVKTRTMIPREHLIAFFETDKTIPQRLDRIEALLAVLVGNDEIQQAVHRILGGETT